MTSPNDPYAPQNSTPQSPDYGTSSSGSFSGSTDFPVPSSSDSSESGSGYGSSYGSAPSQTSQPQSYQQEYGSAPGGYSDQYQPASSGSFSSTYGASDSGDGYGSAPASYGAAQTYGDGGYGGYGQPKPETNILSIIGLALIFFFPPAGLILSWMGWKKAKSSTIPDEPGRVMGLIGLIINGILTAFFAILVIFWIIMFIVAMVGVGTSSTYALTPLLF